MNQCQVIAVPVDTATWPVAFVVPRTNLVPDPNALLRRCKDSLAPFKRPLRIYIVDELPMSHGQNGSKVQRHVLREWETRRLGSNGLLKYLDARSSAAQG
ncbi:2-succinylbenzoate--CoA ligase [Pandoraea terrae]|uniref:2-succinylbenzoate--CoA ligase n=1 Tax=Pandoraea terrae TaxID=1537710 RepID=A0A5E4UWJ2_9BURK|nr:2-succinylbenzoate--CoA ligase [Pandoraea terrae]